MLVLLPFIAIVHFIKHQNEVSSDFGLWLFTNEFHRMTKQPGNSNSDTIATRPSRQLNEYLKKTIETNINVTRRTMEPKKSINYIPLDIVTTLLATASDRAFLW